MNHGIPITYVPARNTILLGLALGMPRWLGRSTCSSGPTSSITGLPRLSPRVPASIRTTRGPGDKAGVEKAGKFRVHRRCRK